MTVNQIEKTLAEFLNAHADRLPFGTEVEKVQVLKGRDRGSAKKRRADAGQASPDGDSLFITLRPAGKAKPEPAGPAAQSGASNLESQLGDLLCALRAAERSPGHSFVALKWFRDSYLPNQGYAWAAAPEARDRALRDVIGRGWVLVEKIANPRNPGFPTSVLKVNASHPGAEALLGSATTLGWGFTPIKIQGEPMTTTLRRMRDEDD